MDYSQSGEQAHILSWAYSTAQLGGNRRWLDIGAFDGTTASNTRALAERGWSGVAVEPAAWPFDRLAELYTDRHDVECVQAAVFVGMQPPLVRFHYTHDLVSTTQPGNAETWKAIVDFSEVWVCALRLDDLLAEFPGPYDMVSVDTEGSSLDIARALLKADALAQHGLLCVECEDGGERWEAQQWCLDGLARVAVTPNNVLLARL